MHALTLALHAMVVRLTASGALGATDLPAMREMALSMPRTLEGSPFTSVQVGGARLTEAVNALFDRLDGTSW